MVAAPALLLEMSRAKQQGIGILGCCPNAAHKRGFHMRPEQILPGDYSLRGSRNKPLGQHCCAIDIGTTSPLMRRYVKTMFERWDADAQPPDMAEFIGSPDGRRVLYASFENPGRVELYRGQGHDVWFHGSKFRALAGKDGRWLDRSGPYMGPLLGEDDPLMAIKEEEFRDLVKAVGRLNSQMDRTDAILSGNTAFKGSNLQQQFAAVNNRLDKLTARLDAVVSPGSAPAPASATPTTPAAPASAAAKPK